MTRKAMVPGSRVSGSWALCMLAVLVASARSAAAADSERGQEPPAAQAEEAGATQGGDAPVRAEAAAEEAPRFAAVPVAVAVVPGVLLHGMGPLAAGDARTAGWLFAMQGTGLGLMLGAVVPVALSGASRRVVGPMYAVGLTGLGLVGVSGLSGLYGVLAPAWGPGVAPQRLPPLELEAGYQYVADRGLTFRHLTVLGAVARLERVRLEAGVRWAPGEGNTRARLGGAYRLLGAPEAARNGADGSALDVELAGLVHRYPTEGFTLGGGEVLARGRLDLSQVGARLSGSFAEMALGLALQGYAYEGAGLEDGLHEQLLFTAGWGVYLGRGGPLRGEAMLYYEHRRDDLAGAIPNTVGVLGSVGVRARTLLGGGWGVAADLQRGSAWVGRLSLVFAPGGAP